MSGIPIGRCTECRTGWHPAPSSCRTCRGAIDAGTVPGEGVVVSWTRIERPPEGFEAPQRVVLVTLDDPAQDAGIPVLAAAPDEVLHTGTRVRVVVAQDGRLVAERR